MGEITLEEQLFLENNKIIRPFSESAKVKNRMCSKLLERAIVDFGADDSYGKSSAKIKEHYGLDVSKSTIRLATIEHAKNISQMKNTKIEQSKAEYIIGSIDGVMVPIVEINKGTEGSKWSKSTCWKECRLAVACKKGSVNPIYHATMGSIDEAGNMLKKCVTRVGLGDKTYVHIVADGAPWIEQQVEKIFGGDAKFLVDFFHVSEYLAEASKCCCAENADIWFESSKTNLKAGNNEQVLSQLKAHSETECTLCDNCLAKKCLNYLEKRAMHLDYKSALDQGLPIGSGIIESGNRHVVQERLKISGAWWIMENAQLMLDLRTLRANGDWDSYWLEQGQKNYHF